METEETTIPERDEEEEELSPCCGSPIIFHDICSYCMEHC